MHREKVSSFVRNDSGVIVGCISKVSGFIITREFETRYNGVDVFANKMVRS